MTDKELLELAAKAAGIEIEWYAPNLEVWDFSQVPDWNPLTDDGAALRLAVKLRVSVHVDENMTDVEACTEAHLSDPCAATRRAIVRAAAEIGKNE
jgi:hypothetical protein